jgi:hypothetical protein
LLRYLHGLVAAEMAVGVLMVLQVEQRAEERVLIMVVLRTGHILTGGIIKVNLLPSHIPSVLILYKPKLLNTSSQSAECAPMDFI